MARLIFAILVTIAIVSFSVGNSDHVELSLIVGSTIKIRLIFLLYVTLAIGMAIPVFYQMWRQVQTKRVPPPARKARRQEPPRRAKQLGPAEL